MAAKKREKMDYLFLGKIAELETEKKIGKKSLEDMRDRCQKAERDHSWGNSFGMAVGFGVVIAILGYFVVGQILSIFAKGVTAGTVMTWSILVGIFQIPVSAVILFISEIFSNRNRWNKYWEMSAARSALYSSNREKLILDFESECEKLYSIFVSHDLVTNFVSKCTDRYISHIDNLNRPITKELVASDEAYIKVCEYYISYNPGDLRLDLHQMRMASLDSHSARCAMARAIAHLISKQFKEKYLKDRAGAVYKLTYSEARVSDEYCQISFNYTAENGNYQGIRSWTEPKTLGTGKNLD